MIDSVDRADYPRLLEVWESAVKGTHHFLSAEDFEFYKYKVPTYFDNLKLYAYKDERGYIKGFLEVSGSKIEMLFVDNRFRKRGIGTELIKFATDNLAADSVDVNEQNEQAINFYVRLGFMIIGRSEVDSEGRKYRLLHLKRAIR